MKGGSIPRFAWAFVILLGIATALILFGSREQYTNPDSGSYRASGLRAFRSLLEKNGFKTRQSLSTIRPIGADELAIAVYLASDSPNFESEAWEKSVALGPLLKKHFEGGGRALVVSVPSSFREASAIALKSPTLVTSTRNGMTRSVSIGATEDRGDWTNFSYSDKDFVVWATPENDPFLWIDRIGNGTMTGVANGIGATNRFIDRDENAAMWLEAVRLACGPVRKVVFLEAAHGRVSEVSLVELIGPWATGAWWQLNVAFILLVCALGTRFGLAGNPRARQRGSREIADAMSELFLRAKATEMAMAAVLEDADRQIRKRLKISGDTPNDVRDRLLPDELAKALYFASNACKERSPISVAVPIAAKLDEEVAKFVGSHGRRPARRKRR